jgi:5-methyltetrahydropteroyltriglutamate--homocysteine methyltransferase
LQAKVQQLTLEFARRGGEDLNLFQKDAHPFELGVGVIDVKNPEVESPELVASHIRKALAVMPAERLFVLPDCGCFHLHRDVAFAKLQAMVAGARLIRQELGK